MIERKQEGGRLSVRVESLQQIVRFDIDTDRCCGCKVCIRNCQENVWQWDEEHKHAWPKYADECVRCYICELKCKGNCFEIVPEEVLRHDPLYSEPIFGKGE
ncbi:MAG: ferredoxin family protein [Clostridiales Family XIII bacterium]|jgi:NAD-dependent dihydropyrimidine dehydrogenase PreA subunit|nr:ferredoxin family protein [Clostridiales Family XIII bacterium]